MVELITMHNRTMKIITLLFALGALSLFFLGCKKDSKVQIEKNHKNPTGDSANDLLSAKEYERLLVEIQYMPGHQPSTEAMTRLENFLASRLNKPDGIELVYTKIPSQNKTKYSLADIQEIEDEYRTVYTDDNTIGTYFLFLDGEYSENSGDGVVLGVAYYKHKHGYFRKIH